MFAFLYFVCWFIVGIFKVMWYTLVAISQCVWWLIVAIARVLENLLAKRGTPGYAPPK